MSELFDDLPSTVAESRLKAGVTRIKKPNNFTTISNHLLNNQTLSAEAVGVASYLLSKPDGWQLLNHELCERFKFGRDKLLRIFAELEGGGYLHRQRTRDLEGRIYTIRSFSDAQMSVVALSPQSALPESANPTVSTKKKPHASQKNWDRWRKEYSDLLVKYVRLAYDNNNARPADADWGTLKRVVNGDSTLTPEALKECLNNRLESQDINLPDPPFTFLPTVRKYAAGPLNKYGKPLHAK